jgi:hypothetical protein
MVLNMHPFVYILSFSDDVHFRDSLYNPWLLRIAGNLYMSSCPEVSDLSLIHSVAQMRAALVAFKVVAWLACIVLTNSRSAPIDAFGFRCLSVHAIVSFVMEQIYTSLRPCVLPIARTMVCGQDLQFERT